jgi:LemA protein
VIDANNSFGGTIGRLLSLQESYPQLRSIDAFMNVQTELAGTENRIKVARDDYTKAVTDYNTTRNQFPTVITASLFGFKEEPFFKADEGAATAPDIGDPNAMRRNNNSATAPAPAANSNK